MDYQKKAFEVEISNGGPRGYETAITLKLPATWAEFHDALQKARIPDGRNCGIELTRSWWAGLSSELIGGAQNLYELNLFAMRLTMLTSVELLSMDGLLKMEQARGTKSIPIPRLINLTFNADCHILPDVFNDESLGAFLYENEMLTKEAMCLLDTTEPGSGYARVSSDSEDQVNSYIAQVDFYTKHIAGKEDWEMVDIYADEGISGLEARNRDDFNRMMADCREGKIDRVLCKSISRFARNTQEYIQFVRELLRLGISIHFEKENIDTGKMTSEQVAQIYGAFAQMESTNHSSNMRFSVRMRMEKGLFVPSSVPYGYRLAGRDLEIIPEEAEVVRRIFSAYLSGQGKDDIARELNQLGVDRGRNREKWHPSTVAYILTNISYTGDMIWQKSCATDTIPFRQVRNLGQKPRYFVEHSHPAIVSCADFQRVQELMSSRKGQFHGTHRISKGSRYDKHIYCGGCGSLCRKKITGGKTYWVCRRHDGNKADCPTPQIPEPEIAAAVLRLYHKLKLGQETVLRPVLSQLQELRERELRSNRKISDIDNEIARISEQNLVLVRLKLKGYVDSALYLSQMDEIDRKLRELRKLRRRLLEAAGEDRQIHDTERMMEYLEDGPEWLDEVPAELFGELIERIIIISPERLKFRLLNGMELAENIERTVR